ncbi:MAG: PIG-L family deacetylase [Tepidiformaceae bacterium]
MTNIVVVSPHLDDALLSCGELLARCGGASVVTLFAGAPADYEVVTAWDRASGFASGEDAVAARREEDLRALESVGARPVWLPFIDSQYPSERGTAECAASLRVALDELGTETVLVPLGLVHPDHVLTNDAAMCVLASDRGRVWYGYEDAIHRSVRGVTDERLRVLRARGVAAVPLPSPRNRAISRKQLALSEYPSQLQALAADSGPGYLDALEPERYWRLQMTGPGDGGVGAPSPVS